MGILRRRQNETSLSRLGLKHRHLLEQPDVYFHGPIRFKIDGSYRNCLALLRPGHLSIRDRKNLEKIDATIRLTKGITFHTNGTSITAGQVHSNTNNVIGRRAAPEKARLVKFEIHTTGSPPAVTTTTAHGQATEIADSDQPEDACQLRKYEFKCKSQAVRDLWKAYILALSAGISPSDCGVHLLPGQIMQIDRLLEMEQKRRSSQRSLPPVTSRSSTETAMSTVSHKGRHSEHRTPLQKSKSAHTSSTVAVARDNTRHKFYKDSSKGVPSYFFEYISREMSEAILTMGSMYGNLLMRRSTSFPNSYALSFRSILNRNTEIFHYEIGPFKKNNSIDHYFEIKMEGKHPKFKCLNDVVKYFIRLTDGLAKCFTTNDLETLGIKQPPYATHYEPPADYEEHPDHGRKPAAPPPLPAQNGRTQSVKQRSSKSGDPNCEEIIMLNDDDDDDDDNEDADTFTGSSVSHVRQSLPPTPPAPLQKSKSSSPKTSEDTPKAQRREQQSVRFTIETAADGDAEPIPEARQQPVRQKNVERIPSPPKLTSPSPPKKTAPAVPAAAPAKAVVQKSDTFSTPTHCPAATKSTAAPVPVPPPPPPPFVSSPPATPLHSDANKKLSAVVGKCPSKHQAADRRSQFAPTEKNLFRIALECEEEVGKNNPDSIKDSSELARQLKGNVKLRVASLEVDDVTGKLVAPNFSRPQKKDFMGELAEKLKLRRQVVEQVC
ncbi:hypothetical protein BV898_11328 [Hypsibius exemplaris]|uniref:SH2 domain-containing protein n=1 Tax=Hypsibius exemplaris TaxID=2072580 RepID=A0A1W0WH03_HYPEX|nr:hypothetical protein BV898_11328 [Hypsibius exemplaris]